jgi:hypothetical protein
MKIYSIKVSRRPIKVRILILLFFIILLSLPGKMSAQTPPAEWTLMFYMDSDNDLEAPQLKDLDEMMIAGNSANVNIVVLCDRSTKGDNEKGYTNRDIGGLKNWTTAKLLFVEKGKLRELADWGELNMGDPANLKKFLQIATSEFPAKHYGLVFGDHGAGWMGIVSDGSANGDSLDTNELPVALKEVTAKIGKLDLIGFDACLMANLEVAKAIAPYGKIMVASEELEPANGWWYTPLIDTLLKNPQMNGAALGKLVIDTYNSFYLGPRQKNPDPTATLSEIDLEKISAIEIAVNNLGISNQAFLKAGGRTNWLHTARARSQTEVFAASKGNSFNYYDVVDYAENIKHESADATTAKAADAVIAAVNSAVIYKINGQAHPGSNGLSIYFPLDKKASNGNYLKTLFSINGKWTPFLLDFLGLTSADHQAPQIEEVETDDNDVAKEDVITVTSKVKADDIAEAEFVLAETDKDGEVIIGAIPSEPDEDGVLKEEWDGSWFSIGDGKKELICPITNFEEVDEGNETYLAEVPAQVRYKGTTEWHDVTLYFYLDFNDEEVIGDFVYAFEFENDRAREVEIEAGDSLRPVYLAINKQGEMSEIAADTPDSILRVTGDDNITVGRIDVAPGKYLLGFTVTDYSENTSEEFTEVTIK